MTGRVGYWPAEQATDRQTVEEDAPEWVWNFQWQKMFGANSLLEAKFTGYNGYYNLDPVEPPRIRTTRTRMNTAAAVAVASTTRIAAATRARCRSRNMRSLWQATRSSSASRSSAATCGPNISPTAPLASTSSPTAACRTTGSAMGTTFRATTGDVGVRAGSWTSGRLTLNIGLAAGSHSRLQPGAQRETSTQPANSWGPRVGVAYDLSGRGRPRCGLLGSLLRGRGQRVLYVGNAWLAGDEQHAHQRRRKPRPPEVVDPGDRVRHHVGHQAPTTDEFKSSCETQLTERLRFTATGIWRDTGNFINNVIANAQIQARCKSPMRSTGQPLTVYSWANRGASNDSFSVRNTEGFQYLATNGSSSRTAAPSRKYRGLMLLLDSSLKNRFGYQLSYVLVQSQGDRGQYRVRRLAERGRSGIPPNTAIINTEGELTNSRRHEFKAFASYQVPRIDVTSAAALFRV